MDSGHLDTWKFAICRVEQAICCGHLAVAFAVPTTVQDGRRALGLSCTPAALFVASFAGLCPGAWRPHMCRPWPASADGLCVLTCGTMAAAGAGIRRSDRKGGFPETGEAQGDESPKAGGMTSL